MDFDAPAHELRRDRIKGAGDFDMTVNRIDSAVADFEEPEGLLRQRLQCRLFLCKHDFDLSFGGAVNAGRGPGPIPASEIVILQFQGIELLAGKGVVLDIFDIAFNFAFVFRGSDPARQGDKVIVVCKGEIIGVEFRFIQMGLEHR